ADEELGLAPQRVSQRLVEVREQDLVGMFRVDVAQEQPLRREIGDERLRSRVGEHAPHLCIEYFRIFQTPGDRGIEQLVIRNAAPQEERQARREIEIADAIDRAGGNVGGRTLEAEQELRADEQPLDRLLNAAIESALLAARFIERQQ